MPKVNKLGEDVSPEEVVVAAAIDAGYAARRVTKRLRPRRRRCG
jgi:hypothetical protein